MLLEKLIEQLDLAGFNRYFAIEHRRTFITFSVGSGGELVSIS